MTIKSDKDLQGGNEPKTSNRTLDNKIAEEKDESFVICKTSNYRIDEEFETNYFEQKNAPAQSNKDFNDLLLLSKSLKPNKISRDSQGFASTIVVQDLMKMLRTKEAVVENFYRYCHEINKLNFLLSTVKKTVCFILNLPQLSKMHCFLMIAVISLIKYAKSISSEIYKSLLIRKNAFDLVKFKEFSKSRKYELLIDLFTQNLAKISILIKKIINN